jgi:hypothetical protein
MTNEERYANRIEKTAVEDGKQIFVEELKYIEHGGEDIEYDDIESFGTVVGNLLGGVVFAAFTADALIVAKKELEKKYQCSSDRFMGINAVENFCNPELKLWGLLAAFEPEVLLA